MKPVFDKKQMSDKLEKVNDLIEELQSEINQPIWSEDQREGLIQAQSAVGQVKKSVRCTDLRYSKGGFNHTKPQQ